MHIIVSIAFLYFSSIVFGDEGTYIKILYHILFTLVFAHVYCSSLSDYVFIHDPTQKEEIGAIDLSNIKNKRYKINRKGLHIFTKGKKREEILAMDIDMAASQQTAKALLWYGFLLLGNGFIWLIKYNEITRINYTYQAYMYTSLAFICLIAILITYQRRRTKTGGSLNHKLDTAFIDGSAQKLSRVLLTSFIQSCRDIYAILRQKNNKLLDTIKGIYILATLSIIGYLIRKYAYAVYLDPILIAPPLLIGGLIIILPKIYKARIKIWNSLG